MTRKPRVTHKAPFSYGTFVVGSRTSGLGGRTRESGRRFGWTHVGSVPLLCDRRLARTWTAVALE